MRATHSALNCTHFIHSSISQVHENGTNKQDLCDLYKVHKCAPNCAQEVDFVAVCMEEHLQNAIN